ncbi:MAG: ABC transporter substrate-binding protein [Bacteroidetes bacterium]|nr:ABC transporter substrate-binding protein [Bacteroidota bacterium]
MQTLKVVGVPEHFNYPWQQAIKQGLFTAAGIDLHWTDVPEGTGKMCQLLREGSADMAIILTEGIVRDILHGNPSRIIQEYVASPLLWGIHVGAASKFEKIEDLKNAKVAISRMGSGSHLMACVHAEQQGWDAQNLSFEIVHTIDGAVDALTQETADYFMWEHFMTKPLVDQGIFRHLGDCPTPWPCFVMAVREEVLQNYSSVISQTLRIINEQTQKFKSQPNLNVTLAEKYHQKSEDISQWLSLTEWSQKNISPEVLNQVQNQLWALGLIDKKGTFADIVASV